MLYNKTCPSFTVHRCMKYKMEKSSQIKMNIAPISGYIKCSIQRVVDQKRWCNYGIPLHIWKLLNSNGFIFYGDKKSTVEYMNSTNRGT